MKLTDKVLALYEDEDSPDLFKGMLNKVDNLHAKAVRQATMKIDGKVYDFFFDGRNYIVKEDGNYLSTYNTRKITDAKKWLKDYLKN
jgi:hypothetical protein